MPDIGSAFRGEHFYREDFEGYSGPLVSCADDKTDKHRGRGRIPGAGTHFAHSVTILLSVIDRNVGPESVQSGRVMFM